MKTLSALAVFFLSFGASADDSILLDPPYTEIHRPIVVRRPEGLQTLLPKVDHLKTAQAQTSVKRQGRRGTCSIFSATALLEFKLKQEGIAHEDLDLSEQWLEYLTAGQSGQEGSWSTVNFNTYGEHGFIDEAEWEYNGTSWTPYDENYWRDMAPTWELDQFNTRCLQLSGQFYFDHCLIGQRDPQLLYMGESQLENVDPEFLSIRTSAAEKLENVEIRSRWIDTTADAQALLDKGEAITLDITFFYEAWSHGKAPGFGLIRDMNLWDQGIVSYPDRESMDYEVSRQSENQAGHSVVVVGYDMNMVIEREVMKSDGTPMTVKTKGVYFFKNSWGNDSFGAGFRMKGQSFPGFGMISMDYAHEHGSFARMSVKKLNK